MKSIKTVFACLTAVMVIAISGAPTITLSAKSFNTSPAANTQQQRKSPPASKVVPVPADWIAIEDEEVGYTFEVPKGTKHTVEKKDDIVFIHAVPPAPIAVSVVVMAFKDKLYTKDNLLKIAMGTMKGLGAKSINVGEVAELSEEYSLATYTGAVL